MKKGIPLILALVMCLCLCACGHTDKAATLAQYGEEMFLENDLSKYLDHLRECGLRDLSAEPFFTYSFENDYDKKNHTLKLNCNVKLTSDSIDSYYTTTYNNIAGERLATLMNDILHQIYSKYEYTYENEKFSGTVVISVSDPRHDLYVYTSAGRKYHYNYGYTDYVQVDIDDDTVYMMVPPKTKKLREMQESIKNNMENSILGGSNSASSEDGYSHDKFDAIAIAEKTVKSNLKSPSTAVFCKSSEYTASCVGNTWTVKGYVDAQNSFGATIRNNFTVKITFSSSNKYTVDSCTIS